MIENQLFHDLNQLFMNEFSCFFKSLANAYWKLSYHKRTRLDVFKGEFDDKHLSKQGSTHSAILRNSEQFSIIF